MGHELSLQALPPDALLLAEALADPAIAECWQGQGFSLRASPYADDASRRLNTLIEELVATSQPGIAERCLDLDRRYDELHYVLSARRREEERETETERERLLFLVLRGEPLYPLAGTQGFPVGWAPPHDVARAAVVLASVTEKELEANFIPGAMEAAAVYKFWADRVDEDTLPMIWRDAYALARLYAAAARHGEGILVHRD